MGKSKGGGKKPNVFKVAGAKSLKAKSKPKQVTGNLKKINEIVRKNVVKIDKNLVLLQNNLMQKKEEKVKSNVTEREKVNEGKKEAALEKEKQNTLEMLSHMENIRRMTDKIKRVGIIVIGDEILKGHVKDLNSSFMCKRFHAMGVRVCRIITVPDDITEIAEEVVRFSEKFDIVITTGGIGPTHDDITYEAIANAFNDRIILHSEMAEVIRSYFHGSNEIASNPALKMALIPQSSKVIYILPKSEEFEDKGKHNGLQEKKTQRDKKAFPVVQVKNVYVLPGMTEWLEHAFSSLQKIFENPDVNIYTMTMFLEAAEIKVVKELNDAVNKFQNRVIFGSYCSNASNSEYQLKITLEGTSLDEVTGAYEYLKSKIPVKYLSADLQLKDAELVYELTNGSKSLSTAVGNSLKVIESALKEYSSEEIYISFNGGKDCTVLLHLVWAASKKLDRGNSLNAIYIRPDMAFPEVDAFVNKSAKRYNLKLITIFGPIKAALTELHKQNSKIKGIFMGTKRTDPHSDNLEDFQMCDKDWPPLMRINPILDWSYQDVWDFLRILAVPYCKLYDEGYTSIGNAANTQPNPVLRISESENKYYPAYKLNIHSLERAGRK